MRSPIRRLLGAALMAALAGLAFGAVAMGQDSEEVIISDSLSRRRRHLAEPG
jgi:hypothetical protein